MVVIHAEYGELGRCMLQHVHASHIHTCIHTYVFLFKLNTARLQHVRLT
jgi:hypothetical protein